MPDRTQEIKNLRAVAVASKNYIDKRIDDLQWQLGTYDLSVDTNTDTAHIKQLPSGTIQTTVAKVDGVGYKVNQLIGNLKTTFTTGGVTFTNNGDGSMTLNGTATEEIGSASVGVDVTENITFPRRSHKVLVTCNNTLSGFYIGVSGYSINNSGAFFFNESNPTDWTNGIGCHIVAGTVFNNFKIIPQVFDLTADFGSGNEPSTVEACASAYLSRGVNIYEYTPQQSSIKNNAFTGVKVEGFNKWDEDWYNASLNENTGVFTPGSDYQVSSKNFIPVLPNTTYYFKKPTAVWIAYYDVNKTFISASPIQLNAYTFVIPNNAYYIKFQMQGSYGTTYNNDICINISGSANGTYVPYIAPTTISVDLTQIKDSNNNSLFPSGKMMGNSNVADFITPYNQESRWNEYTFTGNETWNFNVDNNYWYVNINNLNSTNTGTNKLTSNGINVVIVNNEIIRVYLSDNSQITSSSDMNSIFPNGTILQYERATYLTSNTDLTTLTRINAQSNGTITLNNTQNVDMPNTIDYLIEEVKA